ncbi:DUF4399 domain-containing protein [Halopseudomonas sp.]|uniref:DUF4399 domain-containing protein n=1 Tax=Halopseudomonas sp. TaxID=2901191 RepID=UPI00300298AC
MPKTLTRTLSALLLGSLSTLALADSNAETPSAFIISPADGATVSSPVTVQFGLSGMGVAPAGVERAGTGHHHLLVDAQSVPVAGQPIPADDNHRHFGGGQTQVSLDLPPGEHTLQLIMGDQNHVPLQPSVTSDKITITVE